MRRLAPPAVPSDPRSAEPVRKYREWLDAMSPEERAAYERKIHKS